jgi:alpha-galactosidase
MRSATDLSRRELLKTAVAAPLLRVFDRRSQPRMALAEIAKAPAYAVAEGSGEGLTIARDWLDSVCRSRIVNQSSRAIGVREVVLFDLDLDLPPSTPLYGESFQMLSQTSGALGAPKDLGSYSDATHYKIPSPPGTKTMFGAITLTAKARDVVSLGFTSTRRFAGLFRVRPPGSLQVVIDAEGLELGPGESWQLEDFAIATGASHDLALASIGARLSASHPAARPQSPPTGWCSWYCFGPRVTAQNILDNLDAIAKKIPLLRYVQIDDGYQPAMGDWLETGAAFGGEVRTVLDEIKKRGFEPAVWVAPFVAEEQSHVFQQHRDWFVRDSAGAPLRSDAVTFGGWRHGPWYVLDGTHPGVQEHFRTVFDTMHRQWDVAYFKLDANFWGAIHGGRFHDPKATRIEAYRRGMAAIRRGAGDSFILGCNHPIWPSAGLIDGSRSSNDIKRTWDRIKTTAQQNLLRNWQNGRLWWNDPDAICLTGDLPENEFLFHATAIYATGGMALSGDDLATIPDSRLAILKRLVPPTGVAAVFGDDTLSVGTIMLAGKTLVCFFNWGETSVTLTAPGRVAYDVRDFWTGESLGRRREITIKDLPPRSARLLECVRA